MHITATCQACETEIDVEILRWLGNTFLPSFFCFSGHGVSRWYYTIQHVSNPLKMAIIYKYLPNMVSQRDLAWHFRLGIREKYGYGVSYSK